MNDKEKFDVFYKNMKQKYETELEKERNNLNQTISNQKEDNFIVYLLVIGFLDIITVYLLIKYDNLLLDMCFIIFLLVSIIILTKSLISSIKAPKTKKARKKAETMYRKKFKDIIINDLISNFSNNFSYEPKNGISRDNYVAGGEFEKTSIYHSEDLIKGLINNSINYSIAEVHTQNKYIDKDRDIQYIDIFQGIFAKIDTPKTFDSRIYIRKHENILNKHLFNTVNGSRIELDSEEFEKVFDIYGNNKIITLQLLTADIMEELLQFYKDTKIKYEVTIKNNSIYFRFPCKKIFEPNITYKSTINENVIYEHYKILEFTFNIINKIVKTINETEY